MWNHPPKPLRILYVGGPGNILETYKCWAKGQDDPSQVAITYSGQFYETCHALHVETYAISSFHQKEFLQDGLFRIENRPKPFKNASGIFYYAKEILYGLGLIISAISWKADLIIISDGCTPWFLFPLLSIFKIKII